MVKDGQGRVIEPLGYANTTRPGLAVEFIRLSDVIRRDSASRVERLQRLEFNQVMLFLQGSTVHAVDFEQVTCRRGTLLHVLPGQVQQWTITPGLECVGLVFKPEFLFPDRPRAGAMWQERFFDDVAWPVALQLDGADLVATQDWFARLEQVYAEVDDSAASLALLRHLVSAVLLDIARRGGLQPAPPTRASEVDRLRRFKLDVERSFRVTRQVGDYATRLGCSARTLDRSCRQAFGVSAKRFIVDRVVLEAKRLLGHTTLTVAAIGEEVGFSEPTNFTKFFRAEAGALPHQFRAAVQRRGAA